MCKKLDLSYKLLPLSLPTRSLNSLVSFGFFFGSFKLSVSSSLSGCLNYYRIKGNLVPVFKSSLSLLALKRSLFFITKLAQSQSSLLLVSSYLPKISKIVKFFCFEISQHYINFRWIGGMLTNFKQLKRWIKRLYGFDFNVLKRLKYLFTLKKSFEGFKSLRSFPSCLITLNTSRNFWAIKEAALLRIPVISLLNSSDILCGVTYPVLCNYYVTLNIKFFLLLLKEAFLLGKYSLYINNFESK